MLISALLLVALILFVISAIITPSSVPHRLLSIGLAFLTAGLGGLALFGIG